MKKIFFLLTSLFAASLAIANESADTAAIKRDSVLDAMVFDRAEVMPTFPGGAVELMKYLANNIRYPKEARERNLEGKIIIKFTVDTDGSVVEPIILKDGVGGAGCAEEAIRVIKEMPKWNPGSQKGKPVKVFYTLPISFKLGNDVFIPAKYNNEKISLEDYKLSITNKIKKPKQDKDVTYTISIRFSVLENGNISNPFIFQSTTQNKSVLDKITKGVLKMPMWSPEVYNGNARISVQELTFTF
jgi:TonB family protein